MEAGTNDAPWQAGESGACLCADGTHHENSESASVYSLRANACLSLCAG